MIALRSVLFTESGGNSSRAATLFQDIVDDALLPSMKSSFWKTRKQTSFFASAFAFRHMFVLDEETQIDKLQNTIANELLEDPRVEVREAARDSLFAFLSGKRSVHGAMELKFIERFSSSSVSASVVASLPQDQTSLVQHTRSSSGSPLCSLQQCDHRRPTALAQKIHHPRRPVFLRCRSYQRLRSKSLRGDEEKLHQKEKFEKFKERFPSESGTISSAWV